MKILVACEESQEVCKAFRKLGHEAFSCDIQDCSGGHPEWHIKGDVLKVIGYKKVVFADDCTAEEWDEEREYVICSQCSILYSECNCPGPTQDEEYTYIYVGKELYAIQHGFVSEYDMMIAFPPCTHLAVSGAKHFEQKRKDGRQQEGIDFFMAIVNAPIPKIAIENPIGIMSKIYRKPDQIIQPYEFGHPESKSTCLWLKGLPLLKATEWAEFTQYRCKCGNVFDADLGKYGCCDGAAKPLWQNQTKSGQNKLPPSPERARLRSKTYPGIAEALAFQYGNFIKSDIDIKVWNNMPLSKINRIFA